MKPEYRRLFQRAREVAWEGGQEIGPFTGVFVRFMHRCKETQPGEPYHESYEHTMFAASTDLRQHLYCKRCHGRIDV